MTTAESHSQPLVEIRDITKLFKVRRRLGVSERREFVHAVDGVSLDIRKGEILSLVGESGCGKTTLARLILRLVEPTEGSIAFDKHNLSATGKREMRNLRVHMQAVFQDPYGSLDPKWTIERIVSEPLIVNRLNRDGSETFSKVCDALTAVGLTPPQSFLGKFPHELSGGQRQRVAIARAIIIRPRLIVADEPVSMLDVSVRTEILSLLLSLREKLELTYLFITHDLAVARYVSDRMAVMYLGKIVEIGPAEEICAKPGHPYTKALLSALPTTDPRKRQHELSLKSELPSAVEIPKGCRFRPRCPLASEKCEVEPDLLRVGEDHFVACYLAQ